MKRASSRIWRGSYKSHDWKHLGKGAWEPKRRPAGGKSGGAQAQARSKKGGGGGGGSGARSGRQQQQQRRRGRKGSRECVCCARETLLAAGVPCKSSRSCRLHLVMPVKGSTGLQCESVAKGCGLSSACWA